MTVQHCIDGQDMLDFLAVQHGFHVTQDDFILFGLGTTQTDIFSLKELFM